MYNCNCELNRKPLYSEKKKPYSYIKSRKIYEVVVANTITKKPLYLGSSKTKKGAEKIYFAFMKQNQKYRYTYTHEKLFGQPNDFRPVLNTNGYCIHCGIACMYIKKVPKNRPMGEYDLLY